MVWADLESAASQVPSSDYMFVLIDANARTSVRIGEEGGQGIGAYGRDIRVSDSNGTSLLRFAGDNKLALVNTFFSVPKRCTSRTFNGTRPADKKRIDYIITRQPHSKLIRNVTVHLQPRTDSDHNIVCARVRLPGRFARNRNQRAPTGRKSIDRRAITPDTTCSQLAHADRTRGHSRRKSGPFRRHTPTVHRGGNIRPNPTVPYIWDFQG